MSFREGRALRTVPRAAFLLALLTTGARASEGGSEFPEVEALGKALFAQDRAAWLATDRLLEASAPPDDLRGWVVVSADEGVRVLFVQEKNDAYCSALQVTVHEGGAGPLRRSDTCEPLTPDQRAMFLARQTALAALRRFCSEDYNTVVLPHKGPEGAWAVYLLAATRKADEVVLGGHVRVLVREQGTEIADYRPLSKACLTLEAASSPTGEPVATVVTHVLDDHPIETHVFLSLLHGRPLVVLTESAMWSVDKGKIRLLMDGEDFKAYMEKAAGSKQKAKGEGEK